MLLHFAFCRHQLSYYLVWWRELIRLFIQSTCSWLWSVPVNQPCTFLLFPLIPISSPFPPTYLLNWRTCALSTWGINYSFLCFSDLSTSHQVPGLFSLCLCLSFTFPFPSPLCILCISWNECKAGSIFPFAFALALWRQASLSPQGLHALSKIKNNPSFVSLEQILETHHVK